MKKGFKFVFRAMGQRKHGQGMGDERRRGRSTGKKEVDEEKEMMDEIQGEEYVPQFMSN